MSLILDMEKILDENRNYQYSWEVLIGRLGDYIHASRPRNNRGGNLPTRKPHMYSKLTKKEPYKPSQGYKAPMVINDEPLPPEQLNKPIVITWD